MLQLWPKSKVRLGKQILLFLTKQARFFLSQHGSR